METEWARYGEANVFFRINNEDNGGYTAYRNHAREIFGYSFTENEKTTERPDYTINDYSIDNDNYKEVLGWNIQFGTNSTSTTNTNPSLLGKIFINSRGEVHYDTTNWAGCAREDARRIGLNYVSSRVSYMNSSLPPNFPDTLNWGDRVYTNLYLHYRPTQVKQNKSERNITNLGYLFIPAKKQEKGKED